MTNTNEPPAVGPQRNAPEILRPPSCKTPDAEDRTDILQNMMLEFGIQTLEHINATAEADMLAGNPITGAHHRAIEKTLAELKKALNEQ